jgi:hypothetical protein
MWPLYSFSIFEVNIGRVGRLPLLGERQLPALDPETFCMGCSDIQEQGQETTSTATNTRASWKERQESLHVYRCPTCEKDHLVNEARHRLAYGRQLTCSCECEVQRRKKVKMKWRNMQRHP